MKKFLIKLGLVSTVLLFLNAGICFADTNSLSGIQVLRFNGNYSIILRTDTAAAFKKHVNSSDSVYFELKNVNAAKNLKTIYDNVSDIYSVSVQVLSKDKLRVYIQGKDVARSRLVFETTQKPYKVAETASQDIKEITLNKPAVHYQPINPENELEDDSFGAFDFVPSADAFKQSVKNFVNSLAENFDYTWVICAMLAAGAIFFAKIMGSKKQELSMPIGLVQQNTDNNFLNRELNIAGQAVSNLRPQGAQVQKQVNATTAQYASSSYQNSQKNPYTSNVATAPVKPKVMPATPALNLNVQPKAPVKPAAKTSISQPNRPAAPVNQTSPVKKPSIDSIKFLESMTKIYEKNGRQDLANGIKSNIMKVKSNL